MCKCIFASLRLLVALQLISIVWCQSDDGLSDDDQYPEPSDDNGDDTATFCPSAKPLVFTVIVSPPYSTNVSGNWDEYDSPNLGLLSALFKVCECLQRHINVSIKTVASKKELEKLVKTNRTDFGFPLFRTTDKTKVFQKMYYPCSSHPGLDLFVIPKSQNPGEVVVKTLLSSWPLLAMSVILTGMAGIVMWILEVVYNREEFPLSFVRGSWEGFWWAFVSMTTVGYGDKCPRTIAGRFFAVVWILAGLILVSVFMANVTTALTSTTYDNHDYALEKLTVGVFSNSVEKLYAERTGAEIIDYTDFESLMDGLKQNDVQGILVDRYVMGFHLEGYPDIELLKTLKRVKHYPAAHLYSFGVVAASENAQEVMATCYNTNNGYLNSTFVSTAKTFVDTVFQKVPKRSINKDKKSFNLFVDSKQDFQKVTYISFGVMAGLLFIGLVFDIIILKKRGKPAQEQDELRVFEPNHLLLDIKKGQDMVIQLQAFLEGIEERVKKQHNG